MTRLKSCHLAVGLIRFLFCLSLFLSTFWSLGEDNPSPTPFDRFRLNVDGEVEHPLRLSLIDLAKLPHQKIRVKDSDGKEKEFEGVALGQILHLAGAKLGEKLRGDILADYLLVGAVDGYRVVFALPELDAAFTDRLVLLADRQDQRPLPQSEGPLRLVIPDEKKRARWVRQVNTLTVRRALDLNRDSGQ